MELLKHEFPEVYARDSSLLILGSFPSVKSREQGFYYGHTQNRFWKVMEILYNVEIPYDIPSKKQFLLEHHIALWDVISQCQIRGSADSTIKNALPNDLQKLVENSQIREIFLNGKIALKLYEKYWKNKGWEYTYLPSTSPANATWSLERLVDAWKVIKK